MCSTSAPSGPQAPHGARVASAMNHDWDRLLVDPQAQARATGWPSLPSALGRGLQHALAAAGGDRSIPIDVADANLAMLVSWAAADELAARVVVQRLVPGLVHAARRRRRQQGMQSAFDELVATAWVLARTYPLDRRPRRVAANLCRDAEYQAFVRPARLRSGDERPVGSLREEGGERSGPARPGARRAAGATATGVMRTGMPATADEVRALLVEAIGSGIDRRALALVVELHLAGRHPRAVAGELHVSERTVRMRRDAVVRQLARMAAAA